MSTKELLELQIEEKEPQGVENPMGEEWMSMDNRDTETRVENLPGDWKLHMKLQQNGESSWDERWQRSEEKHHTKTMETFPEELDGGFWSCTVSGTHELELHGVPSCSYVPCTMSGVTHEEMCHSDST